MELLSPPSLSFLSLIPPHFPPPIELFSPNSSGMSSLPHVNTPLALFGFPLSIYPTFGFPSSQVVTHIPHGPHLGSCLIFSTFDKWLNVSHSNKLQVSFVTLGALKNVKFRLTRNLTKFNHVARFGETILMVKFNSSSKI